MHRRGHRRLRFGRGQTVVEAGDDDAGRRFGRELTILGIFDSGLGGLTVLRRVRALAPHADITYLADQAHVPYGDRSEDELARLLAANLAALEASGARAIVMGCNTSCAVAAKRGWPAASVPILDLIATAARAVAGSGARRVGVLATTATIRTGAYGDAIRALAPQCDVVEVAAPKLVPLVESGLLAGPVARAAVVEALAPFDRSLDALVLACTHYPLLDAEFAAVLGAAVARIDPADAQAAEAVRCGREAGVVPGSGTTRFMTTGDVAPYRAAIEAILGPLGPRETVASASGRAVRL